MELRQLRFFLRASDTLNFSEAAKQLFVTQSALSQNIKQLEEELGVTLFNRNSHEVYLTEAGKELVTYAREALRTADNCTARMNDLAQMKCGTLRIGVTHSFSLMTTEVLAQFMVLYPGIKVEIVYKTTEELQELLSHHELDFVLSYKPKHTAAQVESTPLVSDRLAVIVQEGHPLTKKESVTLKDLKDYHFVLPSKGMQARTTLDDVLSAKDTELHVSIEFNLLSPLLRMANNTHLLTILSCSSVNAYGYEGLCAVPLAEEGTEMLGCIHTSKGSYLKHAVSEMLRLLREYIDFHFVKR